MRLPYYGKNLILLLLWHPDLEKKEIIIAYHKATSADELSIDDRRMFDLAIEAMQNAYAPYSQFKVGCAVLLENGEVVKGSNQENMAYPSGLCAERVALFSASANYPGVPIKVLAVVAQPIAQGSDMTISPCGSCRQVMVEYERIQKEPMRIITGAANGSIMITDNTNALLPLAFFDGGLSKD